MMSMRKGSKQHTEDTPIESFQMEDLYPRGYISPFNHRKMEKSISPFSHSKTEKVISPFHHRKMEKGISPFHHSKTGKKMSPFHHSKMDHKQVFHLVDNLRSPTYESFGVNYCVR